MTTSNNDNLGNFNYQGETKKTREEYRSDINKLSILTELISRAIVNEKESNNKNKEIK